MDDILRSALARGKPVAAKRVQEMVEAMKQAIHLEQEAHRLFDDATSNLAYGHLSDAMRDGYVKQTYRATAMHREAMEALRAIVGEVE